MQTRPAVQGVQAAHAKFALVLTLSSVGCGGLLSHEEYPPDTAVAVDSSAADSFAGDTASLDATSEALDTLETGGSGDAPTLDVPDSTVLGPSFCAVAGDGVTNCGEGESCCTTRLVTGGTFSRSYDGVFYKDASFKATVSNFRLDKYEVTVGRFRQFVAAVAGGWLPLSGSGKHTHLNAGSGLVAGGGHEPGWDPAWNTVLPNSKAMWDSSTYLGCKIATWTPKPSTNERRPINCIDWYQAAAFCIWDGGFLPSEAEWNYAASGGSEQRVYPWSTPPSSTTISDSYAFYFAESPSANVGSRSPLGNGPYGQADIAGNVWEWTLDYLIVPYGEAMCTDCVALLPSSQKVIRGGSIFDSSGGLLTSFRGGFAPNSRYANVGVRCARTP